MKTQGTLAKGNREENYEGGGGTPSMRKEISLEEMEYQSPAKKRKIKNEFNSKPSDLEITYTNNGGSILPTNKPQSDDSAN